MARRRVKMSKSSSRKRFRSAASRVHPRNHRPVMKRGGGRM